MLLSIPSLAKLRSPIIRTVLFLISALLLIDAIATICYAIRYPYVINTDFPELYISDSSTLVVAYSGISGLAILVCISTAVAAISKSTNYTVIHAGVIGIFVPLSILIYFNVKTERYEKLYEHFDEHLLENYTPNSNKLPNIEPPVKMLLLKHIDDIQSKLHCCGPTSKMNWTSKYDGFLPGSCCDKPNEATNDIWARDFKEDHDFKFNYCNESSAYDKGCQVTMREDEEGRTTQLSELFVFMILISLANTISSLILYGLNKTEANEHECPNIELAELGTQDQVLGTSIKSRPSMVSTHEAVATRAQIVRFNLANSPRQSISGPSKFSAAARRGSSFN